MPVCSLHSDNQWDAKLNSQQIKYKKAGKGKNYVLSEQDHVMKLVVGKRRMKLCRKKLKGYYGHRRAQEP